MFLLGRAIAESPLLPRLCHLRYHCSCGVAVPQVHVGRRVSGAEVRGNYGVAVQTVQRHLHLDAEVAAAVVDGEGVGGSAEHATQRLPSAVLCGV